MDSQAWDARYAVAASMWGAEPNRWVVRELGALAAGRALDLASGEGRNALWLAGRGWRVTAVDFSEVAVDRARQLAEAAEVTERLTVLRADLLDYRPTPGGYDLVLIAYLHLPAAQRRGVLRRAAEALAPGGTLLVTGHDSTNPTEGVGGPQDPAVLYSPQDLLDDLAGLGLHTVRAERLHRPVAGSGTGRGTAAGGENGSAEAVDALVRVDRP
ncbi:methyltransferase [Kitasatospora sp. MMS16-BH015]|uniref:SAM-dependent methyltransferase n=1 Tax=Kitasatospora sp. MMS16-BH015 TaxID=2018025 RepID=UPI000CA23621|nr:class I SAM-dependent methyltransferase [Kitasatospora sp. MMS16-BH015]AUG75071.1 methyltransferase [Kitasatospora sp. MMS16-BH015]